MDRKRNKLCIAAGVISLLTGLVYLSTAVELFSKGALKLLQDVLELQQMLPQDLQNVLTFMRVYFVLSTVVALLFAILFIVVGIMKKPVNKTFLIISAIIVTLCGGGLVTLILLLCAICHNPQPQYVMQPSATVQPEPTTTPTPQDTTKEIEDKIKNLKKLKSEGAITEEEYNELLKSLFK